MSSSMNAPLVIKIGGTTAEDPATSGPLWDAVASLAGAGPVVVVHGGGKAVDRLLERLGERVERREGLRVTPPAQIGLIAGVLAGSVNKAIVAALAARRVRAVGLCLGDGELLATRRHGGDLGLVGEVIDEDDEAGARGAGELRPDLARVLLGAGFTPIVSSIGIAREGELLNVNADDAAAGLARRVGARSLLLLTDVPGILGAGRELLREVSGGTIEALVASGVITGGMIVKARAAAQTATRLGAPVVILPGNDPLSLRAWARGDAIGTRVVPESGVATAR